MTSKFKNIKGVECRYFELGQGDPLIVVHPFLADATTWMGVNEFLAQRFTVYAPDLPGYGKTGNSKWEISLKGFSDFLIDFCESFSFNNISICGISMGAAITTYARTKLDDKVKEYVLIEPLFAWHYSKLAERHKTMSHLLSFAGNVPLSPRFFNKVINSDRWLSSVLSFFCKRKAKDHEKMAQLLARYRACEFDVFRKILKDIMHLDLNEETLVSSKSTFLAMSTNDETLDTKATIEGYRSLYPNLKYINLPLPHDPMKPVTKEFLNSQFINLLDLITAV